MHFNNKQSISGHITAIRQKCTDALRAVVQDGEGAADAVKPYILEHIKAIHDQLPENFESSCLIDLRRHVRFSQQGDYFDILQHDLPGFEEEVNALTVQEVIGIDPSAIKPLLHPVILESAWQQFLDGHERESVLSAFIAVFDLIRSRTSIDLDGAKLVDKVFSEASPYLIFSNLDTESGKNDQRGFMQILRGAYQGIRNLKAHTLQHDLDVCKTLQYLIFASLLVRRIDGARPMNNNNNVNL